MKTTEEENRAKLEKHMVIIDALVKVVERLSIILIKQGIENIPELKNLDKALIAVKKQ
jgi:hypothetical protein